MTKFASKDLAELAHQLQLSPKAKRLSQLQGIETLLGLIQSDRTYPYDMVCFHITGYRNRRNSEKKPLAGSSLISDLVLLAEELTRKTAIPVEELTEPYRACEEVASDLGVSTKTIRRWRHRGLMGLRAMCEDGVSRLLYLKSTIERFVAQNEDLVERGSSFKQLTQAEKDAIVNRAKELVEHKRIKLHVVARQISEEVGRAIETIRYTLRRYDQANPEEALFSGNGLPMVSETHRKVWAARERGVGVATIAKSTKISKEKVTAIVREMRARTLKSTPVDYVFNDLFSSPDADALILDVPRPAGNGSRSKVRPPKDLPAYLRSLYEVPLMTGDQEVDAFRRYNYTKFKAASLVEALDVCDVREADVARIEGLIEDASNLRQEIVRANLRLVVSIAKKHVGWSPKFFEVISDGNMSLMRAVEKFDFGRGFKFSTYASWAIIKNFARTIPEEHYHFTRYVTGQEELIDATAGSAPQMGRELDAQGLKDMIRKSMTGLSDRERTIVTSHFGLFGSNETQTLEELGKQFGVTKERVRQIERKAIDKMRGSLPEQVMDLIPG
ncbi:MAG: DNA-directed RNA polymerase sigma-70 factor [Phycisphaerae bacterium]|nr:MAG: DNA-directed RNA polymerase sigma-70 factor [Phycisphaerae bacterium]